MLEQPQEKNAMSKGRRRRTLAGRISLYVFLGSWVIIASHNFYFWSVWSNGSEAPTSTQTVPVSNKNGVRYITPKQDGRRKTLQSLMGHAGWTAFGSFVLFAATFNRSPSVGRDGRMSPDNSSDAGRS